MRRRHGLMYVQMRLHLFSVQWREVGVAFFYGGRDAGQNSYDTKWVTTRKGCPTIETEKIVLFACPV